MRAPEFLAPTRIHVIHHVSSHSAVDWGLRDALQLVQQVGGRCNTHKCHEDRFAITALLAVLVIALLLIIVAFIFFREDKEEQVTPLCPQLIVRDASLTFKLALNPLVDKLDVFSDSDPNGIFAKVAMDWPDPFRPCASGIASTARLQSTNGMNLATVVARNVAVSGQALALCRSGCEIFGFVEPDTEMRYHVRHRTGVHLLTLAGDFGKWQIDGINPAGVVVFSAKKENEFIVGKVSQHVDAGLLICCVLAAHVHRVLQEPVHSAQAMVMQPSHFSMVPKEHLEARRMQSSSSSRPAGSSAVEPPDADSEIQKSPAIGG